MVDWEKERTFSEKIVVDFAYGHRLKLLNYILRKIALAKIQNVDNYNIEDLTVHCVGNSHLDSAWLWRKSDTREKKVHATFSRNVFHLTEEPFPKYTFTANATVHYEWIKQDFPQLYRKIKDLIFQGKWEYVGGEYVESDCNVPCGESLIRQRLIGQRFYIKEFGGPAEVAWMDDVFGWPCTIPQILAKSGAKYFYTNKFCYSEYSYTFKPSSEDYAGEEKFPFFHFRWQAPDGSEVLVSWAQHKNNFNKHLKHFNLHSRTVKDLEDNVFNYGLTWSEMNDKCSEEVIPHIINAYGKGDGGMGPTSLEIMEKMVWEDISPIKGVIFVNERAVDYMESLEPYRPRLPVWRDEMYLEGHRGTLTSISMIKENNKTAEVLLNQAESLSVFSGLLGAESFREELLKDWKKALFLQFHDVLPGSSIAEVYRDAGDDYSSIFAHLLSVQEAGLINVAHTLKEEIKNNVITLYNPLGWHRKNGSYLTIFRKNFNAVLDQEMAPLVSQKVSFSPYVCNREVQLGLKEVPGHDYNRKTIGLDQLLAYEAQKPDKLLVFVPYDLELGSFGIQNLYLISKGTPQRKKPKSTILETGSEFAYTNQFFEVKISKRTGRITFLSSPKDEKNLLGKTGIGYALYGDDKTNFDAWNIDPEYKTKPKTLPDVEEIILEEEGPLRHTILIKYRKTYDGTTIHTRISFYRNDPKLYGETLIDWQEDHRLLKLKVDTKFDSSEVVCGNPYGTQVRKTIPNTVYQKAMWEYAFQQFATWKCEKKVFGKFNKIAFYSQSKYGMSATSGTAEFSLLKAAYFEKPNMKYATLDEDYEERSNLIDRGFHRIPWAIECSGEEKTLPDTIKSAYEYNNPLVAAPGGVKHPDASLISINKPNVLITSVKGMEKWMREAPDWFYQPNMSELPFVIRFVEFAGEETECKVEFSELITVKKVFETDLLERIKNNGIQNSDVKLKNKTLSFTIKPHEIKSVLIIARIPLEE